MSLLQAMRSSSSDFLFPKSRNGSLSGMFLKKRRVNTLKLWLTYFPMTRTSHMFHTQLRVCHYSSSATSYKYQLAYVKSLPTASAQSAAADAIATALRLPFVFDFDALFRIDAIVAAKDSDVYPLLQIFLNDGLAEYSAWASSHDDVLTKHSTFLCQNYPS